MQWGWMLPGALNSRVFTPAEILEAAWLVPDRGRRLRPAHRDRGDHHRGLHRLRRRHAGQRHGAAVRQFRRGRGGAVFSGGPAKVAVITSGLFGTMSGSSVSNVITTGAMTIPLMHRIGYRPAVAGGIESAASGRRRADATGDGRRRLRDGGDHRHRLRADPRRRRAGRGAVLLRHPRAVHFEASAAGMAPMAACRHSRPGGRCWPTCTWPCRSR